MKKDQLTKLEWGTVVLLLLFMGLRAHAQVLYRFNRSDGADPAAGVITDSSGNLYGTTQDGGVSGLGTVFELVNSNGGYTEKVLYSFTNSGGDGSLPSAGLIMDSSGNLYGTTAFGGASDSCNGYGCGTVYELVNGNGSYTENVLYRFTGSNSDGANPYAGLTMDASGNLYGTTQGGGASGWGTVFELVNSNGSYTERVLHTFASPNGDGSSPHAGVIMDSS